MEIVSSCIQPPPKKNTQRVTMHVSNGGVKGGWERESLDGPVTGQLVCMSCVWNDDKTRKTQAPVLFELFFSQPLGA